MKLKLIAVVVMAALIGAALYQVPQAKAQAAYFAGFTTGAGVKVGSEGTAAEMTTGTATSTAAAATLNTDSGKITTESLTTAAGVAYTITLTNSLITTASKVFATVETTGTGSPIVGECTAATGSSAITIHNVHASAAFNNTLKIGFKIIK